jgi:hypothetical protein
VTPASPPVPIILLGAPGYGASDLAAALQAQLTAPYKALALSEVSAASASPPPHLILLLGLDGPLDAAARAWDAECRTRLAAQGHSFQVLYGAPTERLQAALRAVATALPHALRHGLPPSVGERATRLRNWNCEKCSDPECEHRLFTALKGLSA